MRNQFILILALSIASVILYKSSFSESKYVYDTNISKDEIFNKTASLPMSWRNCKELRKTENIHDVLFDQLKRFVSVIDNMEYVIAYGTLLGAVRDGDMNPNEVDNDIVMKNDFSPTIELKKRLMAKGLIIFKDDIYRVCDYSRSERTDDPPWKTYVPYTDVYSHLPSLKPFHAKPEVFKTKWKRSKMKIRNIYVKTPDIETSKKWLSLTYGNWMTYQKKNTWKDNLLSRVGI